MQTLSMRKSSFPTLNLLSSSVLGCLLVQALIVSSTHLHSLELDLNPHKPNTLCHPCLCTDLSLSCAGSSEQGPTTLVDLPNTACDLSPHPPHQVLQSSQHFIAPIPQIDTHLHLLLKVLAGRHPIVLLW